MLVFLRMPVRGPVPVTGLGATLAALALSALAQEPPAAPVPAPAATVAPAPSAPDPAARAAAAALTAGSPVGSDIAGKSPEQVMNELERSADRAQEEHPAAPRAAAIERAAVNAASVTLGSLKGMTGPPLPRTSTSGSGR